MCKWLQVWFSQETFADIGKTSYEANGPSGWHLLLVISSMKRLGVFLLPPRWDASLSQGYPHALNSPVTIYTPWWRGALWEYSGCLAPEHNVMSPAWGLEFGPLNNQGSHLVHILLKVKLLQVYLMLQKRDWMVKDWILILMTRYLFILWCFH